jgi:hypothetical protein
MSIRKTFIAALAVALAAAFSPIPQLQAATFNPGSQVGSNSLVQTIAKKKSYKKAGKKSKGKRKARRAGSKGKSSCGTYMYKKGGKCVDARNKK